MIGKYPLGSIVEIVPSSPGPWLVIGGDEKEHTIHPGQVGIILEKNLTIHDNDEFFVYKVLIDGVIYTDLDELMFK